MRHLSICNATTSRTIFLLAPTTNEARIEQVAKLGTWLCVLRLAQKA